RVGIGLGLPAFGGDQNLGGRKSGHVGFKIRVMAGTRIVRARSRSYWAQDLAFAGFCGNPS
ncbi:MAG: hypothetical protein ACK463_23760, partial [Bradyrhizobium sp.]